MSPREIFALRDHLDPGLTGRTLSDASHVASLTDIADQTCLKGRLAELSGRSVLLAVTGQFLAALVMLEIDGIARRMLLCPPDLNPEHLQALIEDADIDAVVTDQPDRFDPAYVVDQLLAAIGRQRDRRLMQRLALDHHVAAGEVLAEPLQADAREDHLRAGRPDVDPDAQERHVVLDPDRVLFERAIGLEVVVVMVRHALVDVRKSRADEVLVALRTTTIRGKKVTASRYRPKETKK